MNAYGGSEGMGAGILSLGTIWRMLVSKCQNIIRVLYTFILNIVLFAYFI
jgi:hypothetical protein